MGGRLLLVTILVTVSVGACAPQPTAPITQPPDQAQTPTEEGESFSYRLEPADARITPEPRHLTTTVTDHNQTRIQIVATIPPSVTITDVTYDGELLITLAPRQTFTVRPVTQYAIDCQLPGYDGLPVIRFVDPLGSPLEVMIESEHAIETICSDLAPLSMPIARLDAIDCCGGLRMAWHLSFLDTETLNAGLDTVIAGMAHVDAVTGELIDVTLTRSVPYPAMAWIRGSGWAQQYLDDGRLLSGELPGGGRMAVSADGSVETRSDMSGKPLSLTEVSKRHRLDFEVEPDSGRLSKLAITDRLTGGETDLLASAGRLTTMEPVLVQWWPSGVPERAAYINMAPIGARWEGSWTENELWRYDIGSGQMEFVITVPGTTFWVFDCGSVLAVPYGDGILLVSVDSDRE